MLHYLSESLVYCVLQVLSKEMEASTKGNSTECDGGMIDGDE